MNACTVAGLSARRPSAYGRRMPSIADEVLAEIHRASLGFSEALR